MPAKAQAEPEARSVGHDYSSNFGAAALETFLALMKPQYTADTTLFHPRMPMSLHHHIDDLALNEA
jgi:hypothetical protein